MKWPSVEGQAKPEEPAVPIRETGSMSFCIAQRKYLIKITSFCASL